MVEWEGGTLGAGGFGPPLNLLYLIKKALQSLRVEEAAIWISTYRT
jgi:hypothetical protein